MIRCPLKGYNFIDVTGIKHPPSHLPPPLTIQITLKPAHALPLHLDQPHPTQETADHPVKSGQAIQGEREIKAERERETEGETEGERVVEVGEDCETVQGTQGRARGNEGGEGREGSKIANEARSAIASEGEE